MPIIQMRIMRIYLLNLLILLLIIRSTSPKSCREPYDASQSPHPLVIPVLRPLDSPLIIRSVLGRLIIRSQVIQFKVSVINKVLILSALGADY
jgi:hypothetical protein